MAVSEVKRIYTQASYEPSQSAVVPVSATVTLCYSIMLMPDLHSCAIPQGRLSVLLASHPRASAGTDGDVITPTIAHQVAFIDNEFGSTENHVNKRALRSSRCQCDSNNEDSVK